MSYGPEDLEVAGRLEQIVKYLSREIGIRDYINYENLQRSAEFIEQALKDLGYEIEIMEYEIMGRIFKNIIAQKKGAESQAPTIIVGAHYDTCSNPGADDNASGVAGLIELARELADEELKSNVKFIAFVNEEPPFFLTEQMGSRVYARKAREKDEPIKAVVILESIGYYRDEINSQRYPAPLGLFYPNRGNFITFVSNFSSRHILKAIASSFKKETDFPLECFVGPAFIPGVSFSDHWSFWKENYPAVMVTDTAYLRNPNYHTQLDLYDTIDYKKMAQVLKGLKAVLVELGS